MESNSENDYDEIIIEEEYETDATDESCVVVSDKEQEQESNITQEEKINPPPIINDDATSTRESSIVFSGVERKKTYNIPLIYQNKPKAAAAEPDYRLLAAKIRNLERKIFEVNLMSISK